MRERERVREGQRYLGKVWGRVRGRLRERD